MRQCLAVSVVSFQMAEGGRFWGRNRSDVRQRDYSAPFGFFVPMTSSTTAQMPAIVKGLETTR